MRETKVLVKKAPYRVPTMAEVRARKKNGLKVISTFSGAGGSCLGFEMAGFTPVWACEFVEPAADTYEANRENVPFCRDDIRTVTPTRILEETRLDRGEADVMEGSPPCGPFSTAGRKEKVWGKVKAYSTGRAQRSDDLSFEFARLLGGIQPKVFVVENVSGLVKGVSKGYFKEILRTFKAAGTEGYEVEARLLDAKWLGVPQSRQRIFFVGVRKDVVRETGIGPVFPKPLSYFYSVADALPHLRGGDHRLGEGHGAWAKTDEKPSPAIVATDAKRPESAFWSGRGWVQERVIHDTGNWVLDKDITDRPCPAVTSEASLALVNGMNSAHFRVEERPRIVRTNGCWNEGTEHALDRPAPSVMAGGIAGAGSDQVLMEGDGENLGTVHRRKFTISELKAICSFPQDFVLTGTYAQQWERLGQSVPPVMMRHQAEALLASGVFEEN